MRGLVVLSLLTVGCDRCAPPPALPDIDLLGFRELVREPDGSLVPVFDRSSSLYLRFHAEPPPGLHLSIGGTVVKERRRETRDMFTLLFTEAPAPQPPPGETTLRLEDERGRTRRAWPVRWDVEPKLRPEVEALIELREKDPDRAIELAMASSDPWACGEAMAAHRARGDLSAAIAAALHCAEVARARGVATEHGRYVRAAAFMLHQERRYREAFELIDRAEEEARSLGDLRGLGRCLYNRGVFASVVADYRLARSSLTAAIDLRWKLGLDSEVANARSMLAGWFLEQGLVERAIHEAEQAIELHAKVDGSDLFRASAEQNLAWILASGSCHAGDTACFDRAERLLDGAQAVFERQNEVSLTAIARLNRAFVAFRKGDLGQAEAHLAAVDSSALGGQAVFLQILSADIALRKGDLDSALAHARAAEARRQGDSEIDDAWRAAYAVGRVLFASNDAEAASRQYLAAIELLEQGVRRSPIREGRASYFLERRDLYREAVEVFLALDRNEEAFLIADRAQSRILRDLSLSLRATGLDEASRRAFIEKVEAIRSRRDAIEEMSRGQRMLTGDELERSEREKTREIAELSRSFDRMLELLDRADPKLEAFESLALGGDEGLIEALDLKEHTVFFLVTNREVRVFEHRAALFRELSASRELEHLYVVDEASPPRLLPTTSIGSARLIEQFTISYLPHASLLAAPREPADGAPLVIVDPTSDLPAARREGERVATLLRDAVILTGDAAARPAVIDALNERRSLVHFAGHGVLEANDPWAAYLALARGDKLTVEDILLVTGGLDLVVLSGCETSRAAGPERLDLASAFLVSGADRVIAAHGKLDDAETAVTMAALYDAGLERQPALALQRVPRSWGRFRAYGRR